LLSNYGIPALRKNKGNIINISSGAANHPIFGGSAYCVSKAGLNQLTKNIAEEEPQITAIAIQPGVVDTPMQKFIRDSGENKMSSSQYEYFMNLKKKNLLEPPYIPARSIAFLSLIAPRELNGQFVSYDTPKIMKQAQKFFKKREN